MAATATNLGTGNTEAEERTTTHAMPAGASGKRKKLDMENAQDEKTTTQSMPDKPAGASGKKRKKKLVRFDKKYTEHILWAGPLAPFPRMSDELIDRLEQPEFPGRVRALQDELCARVQNKIRRHEHIHSQHLDKGHAEVEFSDEDEAAVMEFHARSMGHGGLTLTEEDMAFYAAAGSTAEAWRRWRAESADMPKVVGEDGKRRTVVRLDREYIEWKVTSIAPPRPYPFRSKLDHVRRAMDEEIAADAQKAIDRDKEMRRQYASQGYADIEFTDDEGDEEEMGDWRPYAYRKAAGLVD